MEVVRDCTVTSTPSVEIDLVTNTSDTNSFKQIKFNQDDRKIVGRLLFQKKKSLVIQLEDPPSEFALEKSAVLFLFYKRDGRPV